MAVLYTCSTDPNWSKVDQVRHYVNTHISSGSSDYMWDTPLVVEMIRNNEYPEINCGPSAQAFIQILFEDLGLFGDRVHVFTDNYIANNGQPFHASHTFARVNILMQVGEREIKKEEAHDALYDIYWTDATGRRISPIEILTNATARPSKIEGREYLTDYREAIYLENPGGNTFYYCINKFDPFAENYCNDDGVDSVRCIDGEREIDRIFRDYGAAPTYGIDCPD